jgi:CBS domain-containing protein
VRRDYSLFHAFELLAREEHMHRIPVVDSEKVLVNIISQSHLVEYVHKNIHRIGTKINLPVSHFHEAIKPVATISEHKITIDAFKMMKLKKVTGIAIVNDNQEIMDVLSIKDLKLIVHDEKFFQKLYQPISKFLKELDLKDHKRPKEPVVCHKDATLETVVKKLTEHHIHRMFITDDANKPIGVVGLKEVLYEIVNE